MTRPVPTLVLLCLALTTSPLSGQGLPDRERRLVRPPPGSLSGLVWDSTRSEPLAGAHVVVFGTGLSASTDSLGRFSFPEVPKGVFVVAFSHPRLDSLLAFPPSAQVEIQARAPTEVRLALPSLGTILADACAFEHQPAGTSSLVGSVRVIPTGESIPAARVAIAGRVDSDAAIRSSGLDRLPMHTETDARGQYVLCGVPVGIDLAVVASFFGHWSQEASVRVTSGTHAEVDLGIHLPQGFLTARSEPDLREGGVGTQGVQGWIREPETAAPVRGALVTLRQTPGTIVVTGETSARGFFRLQTPIPGTYSLEAEALSYGKATAEDLTVSVGKLTHLEITMAPAPLELEPLVAIGAPRLFHLEVQGFYDRMERGHGFFLSPEDLEKIHPTDLTQVFRRVPGIRVSRVMGEGTKLTVFRPTYMDGPECTPRLYLDGSVVGTAPYADDNTGIGVSPEQLVSVWDLDAVEFYRGAATVPLVWSTMGDAECGTLVLWTKLGARGGMGG